MFLTLRAISRVPVKSSVCLCHPYILYKCIYKSHRLVALRCKYPGERLLSRWRIAFGRFRLVGAMIPRMPTVLRFVSLNGGFGAANRSLIGHKPSITILD
jgi:hypothetical protein